MEPPRKRPRPASFKIEIPGDDAMETRFLLKLQEVRHHLTSQLNQTLSNWDIMNNVFDFWREQHTASRAAPHTPDHVITKDACNQKLMVVAQSSLEKFQEITEKHSRSCSKKLHITKVVTQCHTSFVTLTCGLKHKYKWPTSPALPNGRRLVDIRIAQSMVTSGLLPIQYKRFVNGIGIGCNSQRARKSFADDYYQYIHQEYDSSCEQAIVEEVAHNADLTKGIELLGDARHGWRKNAKDCSVVAMGNNSHKVIACQHVTKQDDHVAQRHETIGTRKILDSLEANNVTVETWAHDYNTAVNRLVADRGINNQNDLWHGIKNIKKKDENSRTRTFIQAE